MKLDPECQFTHLWRDKDVQFFFIHLWNMKCCAHSNIHQTNLVSSLSSKLSKGSLSVCRMTCFSTTRMNLTGHAVTYLHLRARRALMLFKDVPLRTRRALLLYKVYGDSPLLALNGTSLNSVNALLAPSWRYWPKWIQMVWFWTKSKTSGFGLTSDLWWYSKRMTIHRFVKCHYISLTHKCKGTSSLNRSDYLSAKNSTFEARFEGVLSLYLTETRRKQILSNSINISILHKLQL